MSSLILDHGSLVLKTPYDPGLVAELKTRIPSTDRRFDPEQKAWLVAPQHADLLVHIVRSYFGVDLAVPHLASAEEPEIRLLDVRYIGRCKTREDGSSSAFGWSNASWSVIFPEQILRDWFLAGDHRPGEKQSLYQVLGINSATNETDLKTAYRRLARQWHPDVCQEPDAAEQFRSIQHAYDVLRDPALRAKYNAGLALEASLGRSADTQKPEDSYRSPLRCGWILAEGTQRVGRFIITKILSWEDIVNQHGQTLVTSWIMGADRHTETWV